MTDPNDDPDLYDILKGYWARVVDRLKTTEQPGPINWDSFSGNEPPPEASVCVW